MIFEGTFLQTRVARRILGLFLLCAVVPVAALSVVSYRQVASQLSDQGRGRLRQLGKTTGMSVFERLALIEYQVQSASAVLSASASVDGDPSDIPPLPTANLESIAIQRENGPPIAAYGPLPKLPSLSPEQRRHLASGNAIVTTVITGDKTAILMARSIDVENPSLGSLWAAIDPEFLFGIRIENAGLPPGVDLCVLDQLGRPLYCPEPIVARSSPIAASLSSAEAAQFEWWSDGNAHLAGYWSLFLGSQFEVSQWTFVLSEPRSSVLAPIAELTMTYVLTIVLTLLGVSLLATVQIRRTMSPLEQLQHGTRRIARREFGVPVEVTSNDEFEDLAVSFNVMSSRLERQFSALTVRNEIDRAVLAALDTERIVEEVLKRTPELLRCTVFGVALAKKERDRTMLTVFSATETGRFEHDAELGDEDLSRLLSHREHMWVGRELAHPLPAYLEGSFSSQAGITAVLVLPIRLRNEFRGLIALGYPKMPSSVDEDLTQAQHLSDQVAVALANAGLLGELDELSWGTIRALARTIDAKSPWTAGHTERVSELACSLAASLGVPEEDLDRLHRGALLHDIGKIGIPAELLDKDVALTEEERQIMNLHPSIGAEILEPIAAFADVLPLVLHHHERFDGKGYPDGLAGTDIPHLVRILTVVDAFDAMCSDRPYRVGRSRKEGLRIIESGKGSQFDPEIAQAFVRLMEASETSATATPLLPQQIGYRHVS